MVRRGSCPGISCIPGRQDVPPSPLTTDRSVDRVKRRHKFGPSPPDVVPENLRRAARAPGARAHPERRHDHARSRQGAVAARTPEGLIARLVMLAGVIWRTRWTPGPRGGRHPAPATADPATCPGGRQPDPGPRDGRHPEPATRRRQHPLRPGTSGEPGIGFTAGHRSGPQGPPWLALGHVGPPWRGPVPPEHGWLGDPMTV